MLINYWAAPVRLELDAEFKSSMQSHLVILYIVLENIWCILGATRSCAEYIWYTYDALQLVMPVVQYCWSNNWFCTARLWMFLFFHYTVISKHVRKDEEELKYALTTFLYKSSLTTKVSLKTR